MTRWDKYYTRKTATRYRPRGSGPAPKAPRRFHDGRGGNNTSADKARQLECLREMAAARLPGETFTQATIAEFCGVSHSAISNIEKRTLKKLRERWRRALGLSWTEFRKGRWL
jgi:DNA-binding XRE family transcriptional regulator